MSATRVLVVRGTSMLPSILPGCGLLVEEADPGSLRVGDVVCHVGAGGAGEVVAHRVMAIEDGPGGRVLVTRGDNLRREERVPASAAAYRVLRVSRGPISYSTDEPAGRIVARLALRGSLPWRAFRRLSQVLLAAVSGPHFTHGRAAKAR